MHILSECEVQFAIYKILESDREKIEEGREVGIEEERENSRVKDIGRAKNLLTKKFRILNNDFNKKIESLNSDKLNLIIENILDIENLNEVEKYF